MVIVDPRTEASIGQLQYVRVRSTGALSTGFPTDWKCNILLPGEIYDLVMRAWSEGWHSQINKQYEPTESGEELMAKASEDTQKDYAAAHRISTLLKRSKPDWDSQMGKGVPAFMARFKWEYPWEITFSKVQKDDPTRRAWKDLPAVEELVEDMSTDRPADMEPEANPVSKTQWLKDQLRSSSQAPTAREKLVWIKRRGRTSQANQWH